MLFSMLSLFVLYFSMSDNYFLRFLVVFSVRMLCDGIIKILLSVILFGWVSQL